MKYLFKLALKNILRAKKRAVLTFMMLSFGVAFYIFISGMLEGFDAASFKNLIEFETGHFKIRSESYNDDYPFDTENLIDGYAAIEKGLEKIDFITGWTHRLNILSTIDNGIDSFPVVTVGIDRKRDSKVFSLHKYIAKGSLKKGGALIGNSLAKDMELDIGDPFFVTFKSRQGMMTSRQLIVTGLIQSGDPEVNNATVFMDLDEAMEMINTSGVSEIALTVKDFKKIEQYRKKLEAQFTGLKIFSWKDLSEDFFRLMQAKKKGSGMFVLLIIIIAVAGIINTLLISVYEKRQEIGMLKALGMEDREVRNLFIMEGLIIGVMGSVLGLFLGSLINLYFVHFGIDMASWSAGSGSTWGLKVMGVVKSIWYWPAYINAVIISLAASVFASYYPAKKVMKMRPVECLRTVQ